MVTVELVPRVQSFAFVWNLKIISCSYSIGSGDMLHSTVCHHVWLTHGHPGYFFLLPWQHFSALLCLLIVWKMSKETNGKMSDTEKQRLNSRRWLPYFVYKLLKGSCVWVVACLTNFSLCSWLYIDVEKCVAPYHRPIININTSHTLWNF